MAESETSKNLAVHFAAGLSVFIAVFLTQGLLFDWPRTLDDLEPTFVMGLAAGSGAGLVRLAGGGRRTGVLIPAASLILGFLGFLAVWHAGSKDAGTGILAPLFHITGQMPWTLGTAIFPAAIAACGILVSTAVIQAGIELWRMGKRRPVVVSLVGVATIVTVVILFVLGGSLLSTALASVLERVNISKLWSQPATVIVAVLAVLSTVRRLIDRLNQPVGGRSSR